MGSVRGPATFDLGEDHKVAVLSVTEGEDKPLKYPDMFRAADIMLINKIDLLPHLRFDIAKCRDAALQVNPELQILELVAFGGNNLEGFEKEDGFVAEDSDEPVTAGAPGEDEDF